jgi:hypothetical protein
MTAGQFGFVKYRFIGGHLAAPIKRFQALYSPAFGQTQSALNDLVIQQPF